MSNTNINIEGLLGAIGIKVVGKDDNGLRAWTPFALGAGMSEDSGNDGSLSVKVPDGVWKCHKTDKSGHVIGLYAEMKSVSLYTARKELYSAGLIDAMYTMDRIREDIAMSTGDNECRKDLEKEGKLYQVRKACLVEGCFGELSIERGIREEVFQDIGARGFIGMHDNFFVGNDKNFESAFFFFCTNPPIGGDIRLKAAHIRDVKCKENGWTSRGGYPIWSPRWVESADNVIITEGGWDAIAMYDKLLELGLEGKYQVIGLSGPKNLDKYPEVREYCSGKRVIFCPDNDLSHDKGLEIFHKAWLHLSGVASECRLMKVETKDFNDWIRMPGWGIDRFSRLLKDAQTFFFATSGKKVVLIDDSWCALHGVEKKQHFIDDEGKPVNVFTHNDQRDDPWTDDEIWAISQQHPILYRFLRHTYDNTEQPLLFALVTFLVFFGGSMGRKFKVAMGSFGMLFPNMYCILAAPSGKGKGESSSSLMPVIREVSLAKDWCFNSVQMSAEGFLDCLSEKPHRMFVVGEMRDLLSAGKDNYKSSLMTWLTDVYDCKPVSMRYRKKSADINDPCVSWIGGCVAEDLMGLPAHIMRGGYMGRNVFCCYSGKNRRRRARPQPISDRLKLDLQALFDGIFKTLHIDYKYMDFCPEAGKAFDDWWNKESDRIEGEDDELHTYLERQRTTVVKLAMIFEMLDERHSWPVKDTGIKIGMQAFNTALRMNAIFVRCFEKVMRENMSSSNNLDSRVARIKNKFIRILQKYASENGVPKTLFLRYGHENKKDTDEVLEILCSSKVATQKTVSNVNTRPTTFYYLIDERKYGKKTKVDKLVSEQRDVVPSACVVDGKEVGGEPDGGESVLAGVGEGDGLCEEVVGGESNSENRPF
jgi:hypothetical protein